MESVSTAIRTDRVLRLREVEFRTGRKKSGIYAAIARGEFPKPIKIGSRASGWLESELNGWLLAKISAARDGNEAAGEVTQ